MKKEREIALEILTMRSTNRFIKTIYLEKMVEYDYLNATQKALIKRLVQGVGEREYTLDFVIRTYSSLRLKKIHSAVLDILRLSVYQILYLNKIPIYSVVNEAVNLVKKQKQPRAVAFTNAILHRIAAEQEKIQKDIADSEDWKIKYSITPELIALLKKEYSAEVVESILADSLEEKAQTIRVIKRNQQATEAIAHFQAENIDRIVGGGVLFQEVYKYYGNMEKVPAFQAGYLQVQDESSMLVGYLAAAEKPKLIYDLCAAPGGKSVHIATLLPESQVIASDISQAKIDKILENRQRLGLTNLEVTVQDAAIYDSRKKEPADCVIVDVPCSGLGVISRKPEIKYRVNSDVVAELTEIQAKILEQAANYVKVGGTLFYSTCTILAAENRDIVETFLHKHPDFEIVPFDDDPIFQSENAKQLIQKGSILQQKGMLQILPQKDSQSLHGFFIAKLRKTL